MSRASEGSAETSAARVLEPGAPGAFDVCDFDAQPATAVSEKSDPAQRLGLLLKDIFGGGRDAAGAGVPAARMPARGAGAVTDFVRDPLFWALISMLGLVASGVVVAGGELSRHAAFGFLVVVFYTVGRVVLVLPFCPQPRFESSGWHGLLGGVLFAAGLAFCAHGLRIRPFTAPKQTETLRTGGLHAVVRHPVYTGGLLWTLGWAILFRSILGVALVPVWWLGLLCLVLVEEQSLERVLGEPYREYKARVRGRMIPGLPV